VPAGLEFGVVREDERRTFQPVPFGIITDEVTVVVGGPDAVFAIEKERLGIDGPDAAEVAAGARPGIEDDEMIAGIAEGIEPVPFLVVEQTTAAFLRDQRLPPKDFIRSGVECEQGAPPEAAFRIVPSGPTDRDQQVSASLCSVNGYQDVR
jgi:hypothetical protein